MATNPDPNALAIAQSTDLEKALLGGVLLEPDKLPLVTAKLDVSDLYVDLHRKIYRGILELHAVGIEIGFYQVFEYLQGLEFRIFTDLYDCALPGSMEYLCHEVKEYSRRRAAQRAMITSIESLATPGVDLAEQWQYLSGDFLKLLREESGVITAGEQVISSLKRMDNQDEGEFLKTGYREIDNLTGGAMRSEAWIVAGRPGMGKSSWAASTFLNMGRAGYAAAYVPVEGTAHSQMCRLLAIYTGINLQRIRTGKLLPKEQDRIMHAGSVISGLKLFFIEETNWVRIRAHIQGLKFREPDLAAVFIDYIGLIEVSRNYREREREVAFLSSDIKRLAKDLNVVMFVLVQLNREVEKREDHRPRISDLRESGAIEQDADVILFPYRPAVYGEKTDFPTDVELIIAKNRDGNKGTVKLKFEPDFVRFSERDS